jgi:hypothetical protein
MGAREGMIVGSVLLAICFLASAATHALEAAQSGAGSSGSSSELPAFLDDDRLPALEEAWRASERPSEPETTPSALPNATPSPEAAGDATTVRERAEALSRRFWAKPGAAAQNPAPPVTIAPAVVPEPASEPREPPTIPEVKPGNAQTATTVTPVMPARKSAMPGAKTRTNAPYPTDTASTQSDFSSEKLRLAAPPPPPQSIPPLPRRAPASRLEPAVETKSVVARPRPVRTYSASTTATNPAEPPPDPQAALRGTIMTNQLRSFGWNSQPK